MSHSLVAYSHAAPPVSLELGKVKKTPRGQRNPPTVTQQWRPGQSRRVTDAQAADILEGAKREGVDHLFTVTPERRGGAPEPSQEAPEGVPAADDKGAARASAYAASQARIKKRAEAEAKAKKPKGKAKPSSS